MDGAYLQILFLQHQCRELIPFKEHGRKLEEQTHANIAIKNVKQIRYSTKMVSYVQELSLIETKTVSLGLITSRKRDFFQLLSPNI